MSTDQPYSDWIWSPEHSRYYCYRYSDAGQPEYLWSDASAPNQQQHNRPSRNPDPSPRRQTTAMPQPTAATAASAAVAAKRGSADDVRRFQDGDEVAMAIEERGQVVRASFVVRRGRVDRGGRWEYQLWHEDGTAFEGGAWFREGELS